MPTSGYDVLTLDKPTLFALGNLVQQGAFPSRPDVVRHAVTVFAAKIGPLNGAREGESDTPGQARSRDRVCVCGYPGPHGDCIPYLESCRCGRCKGVLEKLRT